MKHRKSKKSEVNTENIVEKGLIILFHSLNQHFLSRYNVLGMIYTGKYIVPCLCPHRAYSFMGERDDK